MSARYGLPSANQASLALATSPITKCSFAVPGFTISLRVITTREMRARGHLGWLLRLR